MSNNSKFRTEYVCKYASDQDDPDCKDCNGRLLTVNGEQVCCSEGCPSYEKGNEEFQVEVQKQKLEFSAYALIAVAILVIVVIGSFIYRFVTYDADKYKQGNPYEVQSILMGDDYIPPKLP